MGWNINIKTDKVLTEEIINNIIEDCPETLKFGGKQEWGWSLAVDLRLRNKKELGLSGSFGMSGQIAELAAHTLARQLEKRGYKVKISKMS